LGVTGLQPPKIEAGGQLCAGTTLKDIYQIDAPLAKGGMGELYRGHTIETGDLVAIKLIRTDLGNNEAAVALFRKEASALSRLNHPAIVRYFVFSFEPTIRRHFMAMELVEGDSLSDVLKKGPLKPSDVKLLGARLASGLQAAHEQGIIHRDVSPDNIIIQDGKVTRACIIDFGIARSTMTNQATVIGSGFAGKHNYVSPEQVGLFGGNVTEQSDIYSLGLVLAQCLLGHPLDMGGTWFEIVEKRRRIPDLSNIDPQFRSLLQRMLEPEPSDRLATMAEVVAWPVFSTREPTLVSPAPAVSKPGKPIHPRRWAVAFSLATSLFAVATLVLWLRSVPFGDYLEDYAANPAKTVLRYIQNYAGGEFHFWPFGDYLEEHAPNPVEAVLRYIQNYAGGDCFLALPTEITASEAEIHGYADNLAPFNAFDEAFKKQFSRDPKIHFWKLASTTQCPALSFVRQLPLDTNLEPKFEIAKPFVKKGEYIEGSLATHSPYVALLLVDDEGLAHGASASLKPGPNGQTFKIGPLQDSGPGQIVLVAVTSAAPIAALKITEAKPSAEVFATALAQARQLAQPANATMAIIRMN
jgi:serine/threonine-protein kinase